MDSKKKIEYTDKLLHIIQTISHDKKLLNDFFVDLLTPGEFEDVITRWQIVKQLKLGTTQREVAAGLGVSIAKITRGSRALLDKNGGFNKVFNKYVF